MREIRVGWIPQDEVNLPPALLLRLYLLSMRGEEVEFPKGARRRLLSGTPREEDLQWTNRSLQLLETSSWFALAKDASSRLLNLTEVWSRSKIMCNRSDSLIAVLDYVRKIDARATREAALEAIHEAIPSWRPDTWTDKERRAKISAAKCLGYVSDGIPTVVKLVETHCPELLDLIPPKDRQLGESEGA